MVHYELPRLPYRYDELEPYMDAQTLHVHHQIHHQEYADGLNETLKQIRADAHPQYITSILSDMDSVPDDTRDTLSFFGGGYENHKMFWESMMPNADKSPGGKLADAIEIYFDSFEKFKKLFTLQVLSIQGSGWCWLAFNHTYNSIKVMTTQNNDSPWMNRLVPLLGLDMWEHAYYTQYQNNKASYVESWWNLINWNYVENRFEEWSAQ